MTEGLVAVAAAVLLRSDGTVLLAQRPEGKPFAGYWEFPGGKLESGETARAALVRELDEELGIIVRDASPWLRQQFVYPHAHVELHFFRVFAWDGELVGRDGQQFVWQRPGAYTVAPLLPANTRILTALELPPIYGITNAAETDEATFLQRAELAFEGGLRLLQVRDKEWPLARRIAFARVLAARAHAHGARVLFNGTAGEALAADCDGVHWSSRTLKDAISRPGSLLTAASCHTETDIDKAGVLELDFCVLGPVKSTTTHPDAVPIGWSGFANRVQRTRLPVFALGGLATHDSTDAIAHGAHGVALRRNAWT